MSASGRRRGTGGTQAADQAALACSFCGHDYTTVQKLIAGPAVYICDECVGLCNEILAGEAKGSFPHWADRDDEQLMTDIVRLARSRDGVEDSLAAVVRELRRRGFTWARIGETLGMTRQSAWERFSGEE